MVSSLNYLQETDLYEREKPYFSNVPATDGRHTNQKAQTYEDVTFKDVRGHERGFSLDTQGFEIVEYDDGVQDEDFDSDHWIEQNYYPVVHRVLQKALGSVSVHIFDHTVDAPQAHSLKLTVLTRICRFASGSSRTRWVITTGSTVNRVTLHTLASIFAMIVNHRSMLLTAPPDQTTLSGRNRVIFHTGEEAERLLQGRCQIIKHVHPSINK